MGLVNNYVHVLKNYSNFSGRARRREYWLFVLANLIIGVVLWFFSLLPIIGGAFGIIVKLYHSVMQLYMLELGVRRIHDTGHSGLWLVILLGVLYLGGWIVFRIWRAIAGETRAYTEYRLLWLVILSIVICLTGIAYFIWMAIAGEARDNRFGPDPKSVA